jgi:hypothetical protein
VAITADGQPSLLLTHIESVLNRPADEQANSLAVLANAAEDPTLLEPARTLFADRADQILKDASDPILALIVLLASEGIRFLEVVNLLSLDKETLTSVGDRLAVIAGEAST